MESGQHPTGDRPKEERSVQHRLLEQGAISLASYGQHSACSAAPASSSVLPSRSSAVGVRGLHEAITVAEEVAKSFWVVEVGHIGVIPPILLAGGATTVVDHRGSGGTYAMEIRLAFATRLVLSDGKALTRVRLLCTGQCLRDGVSAWGSGRITP